LRGFLEAAALAAAGIAISITLSATLAGCGGFGDGDGGEVAVDKRPGAGASALADSDPERRAADRDHPDLIPPGTYFYREDEASDLDTVRVTVNENWCNFTYSPGGAQVFTTACTLLPERQQAIVAGDVYDRDGELMAADGEFLFAYENATSAGFELHVNEDEYVRLNRRG